ncbi:uncharacterized protein E5676_scaffold299G002450 [Cucumis melo var. makuwa]|nr:uncharacterized protein E6C27_scaffold243G004050 [Cucumis melo var. makuwa]TYK13719.1 uncharacterized protein E5676_scaffold299G002450 [Cucumis melo var. makuwa]
MSVENTLISDAIKGISPRFRAASGDLLYKRFSSVLYRTENEKERRREKRRFVAVRSSPSSVPSSLSSLTAICHLRGQPLSEDEICDQVLGRRPGYSKGLGWGSKSKVRRTTSASSSSTSCPQSTQKEIELQAKVNETLERIEVQDRNHQTLASQVERMQKLIEDFTCAQQGPPRDS